MKNEEMKRLLSGDGIVNLVVRLGIITLCAGLILGLAYTVTKTPIEQQTIKQETEARIDVLPQADDFTQLEVQPDEAFAIVQQVYQGTAGGSPVGYTFAITTKAFSPNLKMTVGIDMNGVVTGVNIGSHEETPGLGANATNPEFLAQYVGVDGPYTVVKAATGVTGEINAITGATITSKGVTDAVSAAREYYNKYLAEGA